MNRKYRFAVLLAALFLLPVFAAQAEEKADFEIDQRRVLQGMNRSWLQGYEPTVPTMFSLWRCPSCPIRRKEAYGLNGSC
jgi:hypothetical protein